MIDSSHSSRSPINTIVTCMLDVLVFLSFALIVASSFELEGKVSSSIVALYSDTPTIPGLAVEVNKSLGKVGEDPLVQSKGEFFFSRHERQCS